MAIGKKLRFEVFKRDGFTCQYCGRNPPTVTLHADHIIAESQGGATDIDNLITSCMDCNLGKGARGLGSIPESLADRVTVAVEREQQMRAYSEAMMVIRQRKEADAGTVNQRWVQQCGPRREGGYYLLEDQLTSIRQFLDHLPLPDVLDAVDIAHSKLPVMGGNDWSTWKYFCGICWKRIKRNRGEDTSRG